MNNMTAKEAYTISMNYLNTMSTDLKPVFDKIRGKSFSWIYLFIY